MKNTRKWEFRSPLMVSIRGAGGAEAEAGTMAAPPPSPLLLIVVLTMALPVDAEYDAPHHCQGRPGWDGAAGDSHADPAISMTGDDG